MKVFVYGTLKFQERNFRNYMSRFKTFAPAHLCGKLYLRETGTPILSVYHEDIRYQGTTNVEDDLREGHLSTFEQVLKPENLEKRNIAKGELYDFPDEFQILSRLDELEEFFGNETSLYNRVLYPVLSHGCYAWVYTIPDSKSEKDYLEARNPENWDPNIEIPHATKVQGL